MGRDGCLGAARVREKGGTVLAQDRDSSVVWGMPGAVVEAGLAEAELPIQELAMEVCRRAALLTATAQAGPLARAGRP
jgi:two-component system chemotaxis response regulator CheB